MKNRNALIWRRSERVPKWFRGVLHQVMYSNITEAHSMITAIDRMLECSADERVVCFEEVCKEEEAYIAFVVNRLVGLSEKELGVLFGIVKDEPRRKTVNDMLITGTHYDRIRNKLLDLC